MEEFNELIKNYEGKLPAKILEDFKKEAHEKGINKKQAEKIIEKLRNDYEAATIAPGEAIGIITAESFGEPGTQMSTAFSEKIIFKVNDKIKLVKIGEFIDRLMELKGSLKINDHSEILPLADLDISVPGLNQDEKIEWKKVIECSRHKPLKRLIKIVTSSGREIVCTDNHSFVTRINNAIHPIKGSDLKIGDRIPVLNNFHTNSVLSDIITSENLVDKDLVEDTDMIYKLGTNAKPLRNFIKLDWLTGFFIGAYLAEGSANNGGISISNINDDYICNAKEFVQTIGLDYVEKHNFRGFSHGRDIVVNSSLLGNLIVNTCGQGSAFKRVPDFAYNASNEFVSGLLRGYFDGDGNFHVDRKMIRASSNSKELVDGIALLLSRFKIFSFKVKDKKNQHWLLIPYKYAPLFLAHIGSSIDYKRGSLEKLANGAKKFWNDVSQDYTDMISGFGDLLHVTAKKLGYPTRYVNNFTKRQKIGRTALYRYTKLFENLAKEKNVDIKEELAVMKRMFESDVIWDELVSIEYVDYGDEYVYDLSVPGLETFTTFEGIITHNTLNVFHFAGVAEVSVTQGLPRLIEILDARKEISTPSMEIYLHKPYNKDVNEVKRVAALIKETRLDELATEFSINLNKMQIEITLNKPKMRNLRISNEHVVKVLGETLKNVKVKDEADKIVLKNKEATANELMETYKLKEKIKGIFVKGIKDVTHVLPVKTQNEFITITSGSNLKEVMEIKEVDETRTTTNDVFEIARTLGIEAARQPIINETVKVIEDQGLDVDIRHIMFVSDVMTTTGSVKGITRSGITGEKKSVLARASFETPLKHIINASLIGEEDELDSVIENVMLNQPVPLGTGLPDLVSNLKVVDPEKLAGREKHKDKEKDKEKDKGKEK